MSRDASKWSARWPLILGWLGLTVLVGGFGSWAFLTEIAGAIIASGRLEVERNRQVIEHPVGGVVASIDVNEGDLVAAGDILIELDKTRLTSELAIADGQLFEVVARRGRLEAERDGHTEITFDPAVLERARLDPEVAELVGGQRNLFEARRESINKELEQLDKRQLQIGNQIEGIDSQLVSLGAQLDLLSEELDAQQRLLDRGLAQAGSVLALRRSVADIQGQLGGLQAERAASEARITETEIEVLKIGTTRREAAISELRDLRFRELELREQRLSLVDELSKQDIRAPVSGIVYNLTVQTLRSVVQPAEPLMYLVPQDRPLIIAAQVDPTHIDQVLVGQAVSLRFSTLEQSQTPELAGHVEILSADALEDEATRMPYYRAEIVLEPGEVERLPSGITLVPGMPVEAFIRTEDRSPIAYLTKPLMDYFRRAFRDG